jgi:diguanylate cyclase
MLDIDTFKQINDRYGHACGDDVIRSVGAILRDCVRGPDMLGRRGGDEFGILLPETGTDGAALMAERIRRRVEAATLEERPGIRITVSIGFAEASSGLNHPAEWIEHADRALYRAKQLGRNRSVGYDAAAGADLAAG